MKQVFKHYKYWEDYNNGMYNLNTENQSELIEKSVNLLSDIKAFHETANQVIENWQISTSVNFTNNEINKRAWLGAASCCYKFGAPEIITRSAWNLLNEEEKRKANSVAQKLIDEWILNRNNTYYAQTVLKF